MTKQKLEGVFSKSISKRSDLWYMKLQVNPFAYTKSPADFLIISKSYIYLVECKETDLRKDHKKTYTFNRLSQESDLIEFENKFEKNKSYVLMLFLKKMLKKSDIYLVPINDYMRTKNNIDKKSMNIIDCKREFSKYKIEVLKGSILKLDVLK